MSANSRWIVIDQGIASASTFLMVLAIGRWLGPPSLGSFSLVLAVWLIVFGIFAAVIEDPMAILGEYSIDKLGAVVSGAAIVSALGAATLGIGGMLLSVFGVDGRAFLMLGLCIPALLIQDLWRRVAFLRNRGSAAALNDTLFLIVEAAALYALKLADMFSAPGAIACWGVGGLVGVGVGILQFRSSPASLRSGLTFLRRGKHLSVWLGLDFFVNRWARQAVFFIVVAIAGQSVLGGIQASLSVLGFTNVLILGGSAAALAQGSNALRSGGERAMMRVVRTNATVLLIAVTLCCTAYAIFSRLVLDTVYGPRFTAYSSLAPIVALAVVVACADTIPAMELRLLRQTKRMFFTRLGLMPLGLGVATLLTISIGPHGAAAAMVAVPFSLTLGAWLALWRSRRPVDQSKRSADHRWLRAQLRVSRASWMMWVTLATGVAVGLLTSRSPSYAIVLAASIAVLGISTVALDSPLDQSALVALVLIAGSVDWSRRVNLGVVTGGAVVSVFCVIVLAIVWLTLQATHTRAALRDLRPLALFVLWAFVAFLVRRASPLVIQNVLVWLAFGLAIGVTKIAVERRPAFAAIIAIKTLSIAMWLAYSLYAGSLLLGGLGGNTIIDPRPFALFALIGVGCGLAWRRLRVRQGIWLALVGTLLILLSLSRLALGVALILWCLGFLDPSTVRGWLRMSAMTTVALCTLIAVLTYVKPLHERFTKGELIHIHTGVAGNVPLNFEGRLEFWKTTWDSFVTSPYVGHGAGASDDLITRTYGARGGQTHNDYLRLLNDYGIIGCALWLVAFATLLRKAVKGWRSALRWQRPDAAFHHAAALVLVAIGLSMITDNVIIYLFVMMPGAVLIGTSLGLAKHAARDVTVSARQKCEPWRERAPLTARV